MNCPFCNKEIPAGVNFCPECGNNLAEFNARTEADVREQAETQTQQNPYAAQENGYNAAAQNGYAQSQQYGYNNAPQNEYTQSQQYGYNNAPQNGYTQYNQQYTYNQAPYTAPVQTEEKKSGKSGLAIASFVLALTGFVSCGLTSLLGFIFGLIGIKSNRKGFAIAGVVISSVFIIAFIIGIILGIADRTFIEEFSEFGDFNQYY